MKKPEENSVAPHDTQELTTDEIMKKLPPDLYDGITGTPDDVIQARIDREKGLLSSLRMAATEAESKGDLGTAKSLRRDLIGIRSYFFERAGTHLKR